MPCFLREAQICLENRGYTCQHKAKLVETVLTNFVGEQSKALAAISKPATFEIVVQKCSKFLDKFDIKILILQSSANCFNAMDLLLAFICHLSINYSRTNSDNSKTTLSNCGNKLMNTDLDVNPMKHMPQTHIPQHSTQYSCAEGACFASSGGGVTRQPERGKRIAIILVLNGCVVPSICCIVVC